MRPPSPYEDLLQAPVFIRPGPDGYGPESTFANQLHRRPADPDREDRAHVQRPGERTVYADAHSCAEGIVAEPREPGVDAPTVFSERTFKMTPTDCGALGFRPTASGAMGAPGATGRGAFPPVETTPSFDPEEAALSRAEVTLPSALSPNLAAVNRACTRAQADASACPDSSRSGRRSSTAQPQPVRGPVYIAFNTDAPLPGLVVILPSSSGSGSTAQSRSAPRASRTPSPATRTCRSGASSPALDQGEASGALSLNRDLCDEDTDRTMSVTLFAHNGKQVSFERELATPGRRPCEAHDPRRGRRATLVAWLTRRAPDRA